MFAQSFHPAPFLLAVAHTAPFREFCALHGIRLSPADEGSNEGLARWAAAVGALPADAQARVEMELAQVHELSGADGGVHLLEAAGGGPLPADDIPSGAVLALWFFVHRRELFRDVFFHHEVAEVDTWRVAKAEAHLSLGDVAANTAALSEEVRAFFRQSAGTGRFCAVEARTHQGAAYFAVRVADRIQLVEGFAEDGTPSLQRLRPALAVLFVYEAGSGSVRLKSPLRADDRVRELFQRFGQAVLGRPIAGFGERFDLDRLKRPVLLLPDAEDMEEVRVKTLCLRYPPRLGRRTLKLETVPADEPGAMAELLRAHVGETAGELAVCHAEIQVRLRQGDRCRSHLIRLWADRCNLGRTPLGDRLRSCLTRWGLRYA